MIDFCDDLIVIGGHREVVRIDIPGTIWKRKKRLRKVEGNRVEQIGGDDGSRKWIADRIGRGHRGRRRYGDRTTAGAALREIALALQSAGNYRGRVRRSEALAGRFKSKKVKGAVTAIVVRQ